MSTPLPQTTLPQLLRRNALRFASLPAMREKRRGIWQTESWAQYCDRVRSLASGLAAWGFASGEVLAVIGTNRPRLYAIQLAAQALGGTAAPMYPETPAHDLEKLLNDARVTMVLAEDQEQIDKVLAIRGGLPALRRLISADGQPIRHYGAKSVHSLEELELAGRDQCILEADPFETGLGLVHADSVALLCYTPGTTGAPKGVRLTHANLISAAQAFRATSPIGPGDDWLACLPMAWIGDAVYTTALHLVTGHVCNCPEGPDTVERDLHELGPAAFFAVPRIWEKLHTQVELKAQQASLLKRSLYRYFHDRAMEAERLGDEQQAVPWKLRALRALGEVLIFGAVRDQLGLRRARWCLTSGGPLGAEVFRYFRALGLPLRQAYGTTEASGFICVQPPDQAYPSTVGVPGPGIEMRVGDGGEILVRGPNVCYGCHPHATAANEAPGARGWLATGDAGQVSKEGHWMILDRKASLSRLADGSPFVPQATENTLKYSPYIAEAMAFLGSDGQVAALIAIAAAPVRSWAEARGLSAPGYRELAQMPEVSRLIRGEVCRLNKGAPHAMHVRRFALLTKELDADDGALTRIGQLRRQVVKEQYASLVAALRRGDAEGDVPMEANDAGPQDSTPRAVLAIENING